MKFKSFCPGFTLLLILVVSACSSGPSDKDVEDAFQVITQILDILPNGFHEGIAVGLQDSDVVEFTFNNEDFTIVQDGRLDLNREQGHLDIEMIWTLDDYLETQSGMTVNGTIELTGSGNIFDKNTTDEDMALGFDLNFSEGAVSAVAFLLDNEAILAQTIPTIRVNGEPYQFENRSLVAMLNKGISALRIQ